MFRPCFAVQPSTVNTRNSSMNRLFVALMLLVLCHGTAKATTTGQLPAWVCEVPDAIFIDGFQPAAARVSLPSNGSGGAVGNVTRVVNVPGYGSRTVYLRVPPSYSPSRPMPLVLALHGQAGSPAAADSEALRARNTWAGIADAEGFIVVAPVGTESTGGWIVPPPNPSDYNLFASAMADAEAAYNIDRSRRIGWGYSAGGHVLHDIMYNDFGAPISIDDFAAYAVSAGVLQGLACNSPSACSALLGTASRHVPLDIHIGNSDPLVSYAQQDRDAFVANGWVLGDDLWFSPFVGGHNYTASHLDTMWQRLCPFQALP